MQLSKEVYARKRIHNGCLVQIENSITWGNCSASLGKPDDAEQSPSWQNFQSKMHNIKDSYIPAYVSSTKLTSVKKFLRIDK